MKKHQKNFLSSKHFNHISHLRIIMRVFMKVKKETASGML